MCYFLNLIHIQMTIHIKNKVPRSRAGLGRRRGCACEKERCHGTLGGLAGVHEGLLGAGGGTTQGSGDLPSGTAIATEDTLSLSLSVTSSSATGYLKRDVNKPSLITTSSSDTHAHAPQRCFTLSYKLR